MRRKSLSDKIRESGPILDQEPEAASGPAPFWTDPSALTPAPALPRAAEPDAGEIYRRAMEYVRGNLSRVRAKEPFSADQGLELAREIVDAVDAGDSLFYLALHQENGEDYLAGHGANMAVFMARLTGNGEASRGDRELLAATGLLHDVGRALVPESLLNKRGPLSETERAEIRKCPEFSRDLLARYVPNLPLLIECAAQIYERADGSGYPKGLKGSEINPYARLLGLADFYEALIHTRPHRPRFLHYNAAREIIRAGKIQFDASLMKTFLRSFTVFPLGSCVRLNSGAVGQVVEIRPDHPLRPKVRILLNCEGDRLGQEQLLDLSLEPLLFVTDAVPNPEK
ncbi:MAG: HD domain-containing protein [Proteobacteria bacterium]|nr:HD domain-containing protein [Pseudomonadota bacterium]